MKEDFPELQVEDCEVKYVDESLEDYLSPAFYLTPPADTNSPNSIYINRASRLEGIELFTTLAHEGFSRPFVSDRLFFLHPIRL